VPRLTYPRHTIASPKVRFAPFCTLERIKEGIRLDNAGEHVSQEEVSHYLAVDWVGEYFPRGILQGGKRK
jgi:predicted transcriptional regulator